MAVLSCWFPTFLILLVITMFLPYRLLAKELQRNDCWVQFVQYQRKSCKYEVSSLRIDFLTKCKQSEIIPRFLKFRVPNNGCFDDKSIREFQQKLLRKELLNAKNHRQELLERLAVKVANLRESIPQKLIPSAVLYVRSAKREIRDKQQLTHRKKLLQLWNKNAHCLVWTIPLCFISWTFLLHSL